MTNVQLPNSLHNLYDDTGKNGKDIKRYLFEKPIDINGISAIFSDHFNAKLKLILQTVEYL